MTTIRKSTTRAAAIATAAAASVPVLLFIGAGTAKAEVNPTYFSNPDGSLEVIYGGGGLSLSVTVIDATNPVGATEDCQYHSVGIRDTPPIPFNTHTWVTGPGPSSPMTILFPQKGGTYSVTVTCHGTGNTAAYSPVVF